MDWLHLIIAGLFEIGWAIGLKYTANFVKPLPSILTVAAMIASFYFLAKALDTIPVGTGYAVWTGIAGTAGLGMLLFSEPVALLRLASIVLILCGIVGLRISA